MRFEPKDIIFDDDVDVVDGNIIDGYLWATGKFVEMAEYKKCDDDDHINIYPCYDIKKDEWYVETVGIMDAKEFTKKLELTESELDYIANKMIEHYFETKENWNDFVKEIKEES